MVSSITIAEALDAPQGARVRVEGVLRSIDPLEAPLVRERCVGYDVACTIFERGTGGLPEFTGTRRVVRWKDATLRDDTGSMRVALESSRVRAPAGQEQSLEDGDAIARLLQVLGLAVQAPAQLQLLERTVRDGARVIVTGTIGLAEDPRGAFRSSARPQRVLRGDRGAPLVLQPR